MNILKAFILGIIQGLTEFLPVSSSGHLVLAEHYLNFHKPGISFEVVLHFGSVIAVLIYFRKDIYKLLKSLFLISSKESEHLNNRNTLFYLIVATTVTAIIGLYFEDILTKTFSLLYLPSMLLFVTGIILFMSDKISTRGLKPHQLGVRKSILIGLGQAFAILPGISRSGTTIALGIFTGLERREAARFSFLLSIPAILGANILKITKIIELEKVYLLSYIVGALAAFVSGYLVISLLITIVRKQKLKYFAFYCWLVSIVTIILFILE